MFVARKLSVNKPCTDQAASVLCCYLHKTPWQTDAGKIPILTRLFGIISVPTYAFYNVGGMVPDTFKVDPSPTKCYYKTKCTIIGGGKPRTATLAGTVSVSHSGHTLERASLYELAGRSWFPKHPVKFVCTINASQTSPRCATA